MSWLIVVGGVIALALAVHFAEQRRSKAILLARRGRRDADRDRFSLTRDVKETWAVDLNTMSLTLTRSDEAAGATFRLERDADGTWHLHPASGSHELTLPAPIAAELEQRYRRRVSGAATPASG